MPSANSYSSPGTTGGNREDLRDDLTILEPEETPFTSMIGKETGATSIHTEKLADTMRAPRLNGSPEGQDANTGGNKAVNRQRFGVYTQRVMEEFSVTDVQQRISENGGTASIADEYEEAKAKTIREVKRDIEAVNCSGQETQRGSNEDNMLTRGKFNWIRTAAQSTLPVPEEFRTPTASIKTGIGTALDGFTEDELNTVMQSIKTVRGGTPKMTLIGGNTVVRTIDKFSRVNESTTNSRYQVHQDGSKHEIELMVEVFKTSMGTLHCIPTEFNNITSAGVGNATAASIIDPADWEMIFLDDLHAKDLDDEGGGPKGYVKAMWQLSCRNPKGSGAIYDSLN